MTGDLADLLRQVLDRDLTDRQLADLRALEVRSGIRVYRLARHLGEPTPRVASRVAALERKDLVVLDRYLGETRVSLTRLGRVAIRLLVDRKIPG